LFFSFFLFDTFYFKATCHGLTQDDGCTKVNESNEIFSGKADANFGLSSSIYQSNNFIISLTTQILIFKEGCAYRSDRATSEV